MIDLTPESAEVLTLDAFDLGDGYMPRCRVCEQFNDWVMKTSARVSEREQTERAGQPEQA